MQDNGSISLSNQNILLMDMTPTSLEFLEFFAEKKGLSAYQITKILESLNKPIDYKNVNKKIHKLKEQRLIKEINVQKNNKRKSIFYELTNEGIFHVLKNGPTPHLIFVGNKFLQNYKENDIFKNLLSPCINFETIDKMCIKINIDILNTDNNEGLVKSSEIDTKKVNLESIHILGFFNYLFDYLRSCCLKLQEMLKEILYKKSDVQYSRSIYYPQPPTYGKDFNNLITFLESEKIIDNIQPKDIKFKHLAIIVIKKEDVEVITRCRLNV